MLLLEASPHYADPASLPPEPWRMGSLAAAQPGVRHNWFYRGSIHSRCRAPCSGWSVVGGSSAINRANCQRGMPEDFAAWAAAGQRHVVVGRFRALGTDTEFAEQWHGSDGPVPVRRPGEADLNAPTRAFVAARRDAGYPDDPDKNAPTAFGVGIRHSISTPTGTGSAPSVDGMTPG